MYFHAQRKLLRGRKQSACHSVGLKEYKKAGILLTRGAAHYENALWQKNTLSWRVPALGHCTSALQLPLFRALCAALDYYTHTEHYTEATRGKRSVT
jgi:hypothetical protein